MNLILQVTHGFHVRNLFDSGLVAELAQTFRVVALARHADAALLRQEYGDMVDVREVSPRPRPIETKLEFVRKRLIINPDRALTVSVFSEQERREQPVRFHLLRLLNQVLGRSRRVRETWLGFERWLIPGTEFDQILDDLRPAAIITANYGTEPDTIRLLRAGKRLGIPSLAIVPSFDNLTSKGVMGARPTKLAVWNETMRREAVQLHGFDKGQVDICGGVQFDIYTRPRCWPSKESVWHELGLDPHRPTIVLGTITPVYFPDNLEIVALLADAIRSGELPEICQVLVRLHPQVVDGGKFGDDLAGYRELAARHPFVAIDVPATRRWPSMQPPARNDMARLATILAHSQVLLVPASTMVLDAAAVDTPIVGLAFDGSSGRAVPGHVERMFSFTHYRPITESGALALARSREELMQTVRDAIDNRAGRAQARSRLAVETLGPRDGGAVRRVVEATRRLVGKE